MYYFKCLLSEKPFSVLAVWVSSASFYTLVAVRDEVSLPLRARTVPSRARRLTCSSCRAAARAHSAGPASAAATWESYSQEAGPAPRRSSGLFVHINWVARLFSGVLQPFSTLGPPEERTARWLVACRRNCVAKYDQFSLANPTEPVKKFPPPRTEDRLSTGRHVPARRQPDSAQRA